MQRLSVAVLRVVPVRMLDGLAVLRATDRGCTKIVSDHLVDLVGRAITHIYVPLGLVPTDVRPTHRIADCNHPQSFEK